ncbi:MAG TPA: hypothetical protein DDX85_09325 [Nitrospiraceae bacterium]|nr:hypothetical protein [Nitrospiraceae bacterium]
MNRYLSLILIFMVSYLALENNSAAHDDEYRALAPILSSAENFFIYLKNSDYDAAWDLLSEKSHKTIIRDVYEVTSKINGDIRREDVIKDFDSRGRMFTNYWNSFHRSFDADMILEHSEWEMGVIRKDEAEIIITYNNAEAPTILKMRKDQDSWKVGLAETFWQRKAMPLLHLIFQ